MTDYGTVVGYFSSQVQAEAAVNALKQAGFQQNQFLPMFRMVCHLTFY